MIAFREWIQEEANEIPEWVHCIPKPGPAPTTWQEWSDWLDETFPLYPLGPSKEEQDQ